MPVELLSVDALTLVYSIWKTMADKPLLLWVNTIVRALGALRLAIGRWADTLERRMWNGSRARCHANVNGKACFRLFVVFAWILTPVSAIPEFDDGVVKTSWVATAIVAIVAIAVSTCLSWLLANLRDRNMQRREREARRLLQAQQQQQFPQLQQLLLQLQLQLLWQQVQQLQPSQQQQPPQMRQPPQQRQPTQQQQPPPPQQPPQQRQPPQQQQPPPQLGPFNIEQALRGDILFDNIRANANDFVQILPPAIP